MSPSTSPGSSLLHLRRPTTLQSYHSKPTLEVVVTDEADDTVDSVCSSPTSVMFCPAPVGLAATQVHTETCNLQRPYPLRRATSDPACSSSNSNSASTSASTTLEQVAFTAGLKSSNPTSLVAKPRSEWQPDQDTALCSQAFCSTMFSQTALPIGPRRHHCRMCGLIFCAQHSTGRLPLDTKNSKGQTIVRSLRVCDGCVEKTEDNAPRRPSESTPSLTSSSDSAFDDEISSPTLFPTRVIDRSLSHTAVDELEPRLAPIEEWMDRSGILSLYPLAVKPSHGKRPVSGSSQRAVGPLFAPSLSERRCAREKQLQRQTRRRMWISTPVTSDVESNDEGDSSGWSIRNASESGIRTPQERERELEWSTF